MASGIAVAVLWGFGDAHFRYPTSPFFPQTTSIFSFPIVLVVGSLLEGCCMPSRLLYHAISLTFAGIFFLTLLIPPTPFRSFFFVDKSSKLPVVFPSFF